MQKIDVRILVIEDDPTLGKAIEQSLKRSGYSAKLVANYNQAKKDFELDEYQGLVADCMLPQKSGVDIAAEFIQIQPNLVTVLTTGIFKEKNFSYEAQQKTKAKAFLNKPFDIQQLIDIFDKNFAEMIEENKEPLFQLLAREQYSTYDKISAIQNTEYINGIDLPLVYSLLMDPQISGELTITYENPPVTVIGFHQGHIDKVQHHDEESYFGTLLVEKGFTTPEELKEGLELVSQKPIGERLIDTSRISPHAIEIIQHEQMLIRISKTIQDTSVKIHFTEGNRKASEVNIDGLLFTNLLSDWICSKINIAWLKAFYTPWEESPLLHGVNYSQSHIVKNLPAVSKFNQIMSKLTGPTLYRNFFFKTPTAKMIYFADCIFIYFKDLFDLAKKIITLKILKQKNQE